MSFQSWWQQKSRRSKAVTVLATLLTLQIGLCFGTPAAVSRFDATLGTHLGRDPFAALGYMFFEAILAAVVFLVFLGVVIFYRPSHANPRPISIAPAQNQELSGNNEDDHRNS